MGRNQSFEFGRLIGFGASFVGDQHKELNVVVHGRWKSRDSDGVCVAKGLWLWRTPNLKVTRFECDRADFEFEASGAIAI